MAKIVPGINDLATLRPDLVLLWNNEKNGTLLPSMVTLGSHKKVWWKCEHGHEWSAYLPSVVNGTRCPICSNHSCLTGFNDLETLYPELLREWNYERNGSLLPSMIFARSVKKVWWKCSLGHEWLTSLYARVRGSGCPVCNGQRGTSFPEQAIFYYLEKYFGSKEGIINRFEFSYNDTSFEVDIYIPSLALAIEHNGSFWHKHKAHKDFLKFECLQDSGVRLIRIIESHKNFLDGDDIYYSFKKYRYANLSWAIKQFFLLMGYDSFVENIDVDKHRLLILERFYIREFAGSIMSKYPEIAQEWNYEKNGMLKPEHFLSGSHQKVWWKCSKGHEWLCSIVKRTSQGYGCPYCSCHRVSKGFNDFASLFPDLAKQWNYSKNGDKSPFDYVFGSVAKVWWVCSKGHEWQAKIRDRVKNHQGCPYCSNRRVLVGFNDLQTLKPQLALQWNYFKNRGLLPSDVTYGSDKSVWWVCPKGHEWKTKIYHRSVYGSGCPICYGRKSSELVDDDNTSVMLNLFE